MTNEETIEKLYDLKLGAMAEAFREMLARPEGTGLSFAERLGLLVDREWLRREESRLARRQKAARLKVAASVEEVAFRTPRGLDRDVFVDLVAGCHSAPIPRPYVSHSLYPLRWHPACLYVQGGRECTRSTS